MSASKYLFQVHTTESCPKNRKEMDERSLALNCTESNGYTCLPNKNITMLLEFCYKRARIPVTKGKHKNQFLYNCLKYEKETHKSSKHLVFFLFCYKPMLCFGF